MQEELVRPGALPSELTLQVLLGNALEIVFLLQARVDIQEGDRTALDEVAARLDLGPETKVASADAAPRAAWSGDSLDVLTAARDALHAVDMDGLTTRLEKLAEALRDLAARREPATSMDSVIADLTALREALRSRRAIEPDEVRGLIATP